uniref:Uncharacterized protein n=1 Tax=Wuchereria bancrofti TaxID=6293 RepID=A0AAF5PVU4_WUCBA
MPFIHSFISYSSYLLDHLNLINNVPLKFNLNGKIIII